MTGGVFPRCRSMRMRRVNEADSTAHTLRLLLGVSDEDRGFATRVRVAMALAGPQRTSDLSLSVCSLSEDWDSVTWRPRAMSFISF